MIATDVVMDRRATMLLVLSLVAGHCASAAEPLSPEQVIAATTDAFAMVVESRYAELEADLEGEYILVDEYLLPRFDFLSACRLMLRDHWKQATPEQRQRFVDAFYRYLVASYGKALLEFRHDTITVLPATGNAPGASARVRTKVKVTDGSVFDVDFYMRLDDRGWRVVDVIAEGVSYVRTYRSEFGIEIRASSLQALTARLEDARR
jgi:phospholipid transport system substrate-binding protein